MLCELCKLNEANIHLIKVIDGKTEKMHICINCLRKFKIIPSEEVLNDLNDVIQKVLDVDVKITDNIKPLVVYDRFLSDLKNIPSKVCSNCGTNLEFIKKTGKVGCEGCYNEFRNDLTPILGKIQAGIKHVGKLPLRTTITAKIEKQIRDLENKLRQEVIVENFEEAAKLRDTIRKLKNKLSIGKKNR